jgi:hypothetical protein
MTSTVRSPKTVGTDSHKDKRLNAMLMNSTASAGAHAPEFVPTTMMSSRHKHGLPTLHQPGLKAPKSHIGQVTCKRTKRWLETSDSLIGNTRPNRRAEREAEPTSKKNRKKIENRKKTSKKKIESM